MSGIHQPLLTYISKHIALNTEETEWVCSAFKLKKIRKRQYLLQAGDKCHYENFVVKGCLRAYYLGDDEEEHVVQFAVENWWISDLSGFLTGDDAQLHIDALEDSEVLQVHYRDLESLYLKVPKLERLFRILMQNAFVALQRRTIQSLSLTARERYLLFTQKYPSFEQRIPQIHIASYLGMTPEFLSKIRKQLASGDTIS